MNCATLPLLAAPLLLGCATVPDRPAEGPARFGQTVYVDGPTVRPLTLIEDSRCPANARCIWAGRVTVRAEVRGGNWRRTLDVTLGEPGVPVADGALRLIAVTPEKWGEPIARRDYRFTFEFQGEL